MLNSYGKLPVPQFTTEHSLLVGKGNVYSLQQVLEHGIPVFEGHAPFSVMPFVRHGDSDDLLEGPAGFSSEITIMGQHTGTHIDAFCHFSKLMGEERVLYNDEKVVQNHQGIQKWSIEQMPPIVTRGVLLDFPALFGVDVLEDSYAINSEDIKACLKKQNIEIKPGDCVLIRTGFTKYWKSQNNRFLSKHAGVNLDGATYLVEKGAIALGGDTSTFEALPSPRHDVHVYLLVEQGVPIIECLNLEQLANDKVYEFFFIAAPLKLKGATASIIHPIAIG
jgi:kynurenine formamidase